MTLVLKVCLENGRDDLSGRSGEVRATGEPDEARSALNQSKQRIARVLEKPGLTVNLRHWRKPSGLQLIEPILLLSVTNRFFLQS